MKNENFIFGKWKKFSGFQPSNPRSIHLLQHSYNFSFRRRLVAIYLYIDDLFSFSNFRLRIGLVEIENDDEKQTFAEVNETWNRIGIEPYYIGS